MNSVREKIEQFHLLFLEQLSRQLDSQLYAIKGGCNLRFFFKSIRYSEDLDIDVRTIAVDTLQKKINRILKSIPFQHILKTRQIHIDNISMPKQTQTTQRWKLILKTELPLPLNTKLEFSRRGMSNQIDYDAIDPDIIQQYHFIPILCPHYDKTLALSQKISALAGRSHTQARDVFDIFWLIKTSGVLLCRLNTSLIEKAQSKAYSITLNDFKSQVIAFLAPEYQAQYSEPIMWEKIVTDVIEQLEMLRK